MCQSNNNVNLTEEVAIIDGKERLNPLLFTSESKIRLWAVLLALFPIYLNIASSLSIFPLLGGIIKFIDGTTDREIWLLIPVLFSLLAIGVPFLLFRCKIKKQKRLLSEKVPEDDLVWTVYNRLSSKIRAEVGYIPELWYSDDEGSPRVFGTNKKAIIVLPKAWVEKLNLGTHDGKKTLEGLLLHELSHVIDKDINILEFTRQLIYCYWFVMMIQCIWVLLALVFNIELAFVINTVMLFFDVNRAIPGTITFILLGLFGYYLLFLSARRKRELRADFRAMVIQKTSRHIERLFDIEKEIKLEWVVRQVIQQPIPGTGFVNNSIPRNIFGCAICKWIELFAHLLGKILWGIGSVFSYLIYPPLITHPSSENRKDYLNHSNECFFKFDAELAIMLGGLSSFVRNSLYNLILSAPVKIPPRALICVNSIFFSFLFLLILLAANPSIIKSSKFHPSFTKVVLYLALGLILGNMVWGLYIDPSPLGIILLLAEPVKLILNLIFFYYYIKVSYQYVRLYPRSQCLQRMKILAMSITTIIFFSYATKPADPFSETVIWNYIRLTIIIILVFAFMLYYIRLRRRAKPRCQCKARPVKAICPTCGKPLYSGWLVTESMAWAADTESASQDLD
jgi:Zn-dependent protease with chaperone function